MSLFTSQQIEELETDLDAKHVTQRAKGKINLSYVEGWHVIAEANRVFGFGEWDRETLRLEQLGQAYQNARGTNIVDYMARVRITVRGEGSQEVVRDGCGFGSGASAQLGDAHESALKEAETDAMKRALMTFGWPFGLALYDKTQEHVANLKHKPQPPAGSYGADANKDFPSKEVDPAGDWTAWDKHMRTAIASSGNMGELKQLWIDNAKHLKEYSDKFMPAFQALEQEKDIRKGML